MSRNYKFHNPEEYVYSSAVDYADQKGFIDDVLVFRMLNRKTLQTHTTHKKTGQADIVTVEHYDYDPAGRLLTQKQTLNGQAQELISENHYDALGQLESKGVGGATTASIPLQTIDYAYNVRGWLKRINTPGALGDDLFGFELNYNTPQGPTTSTY